MRDILEIHLEFQLAVTAAVNAAGVKPPPEVVAEGTEAVCALMVVTGIKEQGDPVGCSINWDREAQLWRVGTEVQGATPLDREEASK